jgi:hypothetical protein
VECTGDADVGRVPVWSHGDDGRGDIDPSYGAMRLGSEMEQVPSNDALEQLELAFARLDWAQAAGCCDLPSQREAMQWHVACCAAARHAINRTPTESGAA